MLGPPRPALGQAGLLVESKHARAINKLISNDVIIITQFNVQLEESEESSSDSDMDRDQKKKMLDISKRFVEQVKDVLQDSPELPSKPGTR